MGKVHVILERLTNLKDADGIGKSDPYVKLTLIKDNFGPFDTKFGTQESSHKMNDLNPTYNEEFIFHGTPDSLENLVLEVQVFDDDIGKDDKLGKCKFKLADIDGNLFGNYVSVEKKIDNKWFARDAKIYLKIKMSK